MKKTVVFLLLILCLAQVFSIPAQANVFGSCHTLQAQFALANNAAHSGTAKAALLYERNTQTLVYARNPDERINPTGLIKLLSALIVLEEGNLDDVVTVRRSTLNSVALGAVSAGLKAGEEITLRDLLYCVMISSANDATAVMAEHVAGSQSEFVAKMNARAATAGCVNTHFTNVHGLKDDRQYSTARDLAILLDMALQNPKFCELFAVTQYILPATNLSSQRQLRTTNYLMDPTSKYYDERVTGGKPAAATTTDRSVICTARSGDSEYLCVIISATARTSGSAVTRFTNFDEASELLDLGCDEYSVQQVMGTQQPFAMYPVLGGENSVIVGPDAEAFALLPKQFDPMKLQFVDAPISERLIAPVKAGTAVGSLDIYYDSILIGKVRLLARHDVAEQGNHIQSPDDTNERHTTIGQFVKWGGICLLIVAVLAVMVLIVMRHMNKINRRKRQKGGV